MHKEKSPPEKSLDDSTYSEKSHEKESPDLTAKRASIFQVWRYAGPLDMVMVILGSFLAIITGLGFPFLSIVIGNVSETFINLENARLVRDTGLDNDTALWNEARQTFQDNVINSCIKYAVIGAIIATSSFVEVTCFLVSCENITNRMKRAFFKAIMRQDIAWYDKNHSGTLATKLFDSMERVKEGLGDKLGLMIQFTAQFFGGLGVAMYYDWKLTLIMMALSPVIIFCGAFMARMMASATAEETKKYAIAGQIAEEVLTSIRTVFAFNGQEQEAKRYDAALEAGKLDGYKKSIYIGAGLSSTFVVIFCSYCLAFWVGTDYIYWKMATSSKVLTVFFSVMMGSMAMAQAGQQFAVFGVALGAAGVVLQIVDREPEIDSYSKEGKKLDHIKGEVKVENVFFSYPTRKDVPILQGISLTCRPGETVALVGSSGCGKSTIVQLLLRYYNLDSGRITIDGVPLEDLNVEFTRRVIGVVSQEPVLFNTTILENLRYGNPHATDGEIQAALRKANALNFIESFPQGLNTLVGDRGAQMSGGQKQRIAIARALLRDPRILLLDEATSALDAESESIVQKALENASLGRTTIVIAHRLSTIRNADKIIALKGGRVVEVGTHDELLARKGLYHELVNAQVFADVEDSQESKGQKKATRQISRQLSRGSQKKRGDSFHFENADEPKKAIKDNETEMERLKREMEEEGVQEQNLFKIFKYAKPDWVWLLLGTIACIIQGAVFPVFSLVFTQIMQVFAEPDQAKLRHNGHMWSLSFLGLAAVQGSTMLIQSTFYGIAAERLTMRLRSKVFRNVLRQDGAYFDHPSHAAGKISTRLATDAPNVKAAVDYRLGSVFNAAVALCAGTAIAFYYTWQMALLMFALMPILGIGESLRIRMFMEGKTTGDDVKEVEVSGKIAMEAVENIRTVQALTLESLLFDKFCDHLNGPHQASKRKAIIQGVAFAVANSLLFFMFAAEFRFGGWLITADHVGNPIDVMRSMMAIQFSSTSLGMASAYFPEYSKAKIAAGLIFKMLAETPQIDNFSRGGKVTPIQGAITFNGVHFAYPQRQEIKVLNGLDFKVQPGETLALVGSSGCGKSTVVSLLERFYDPAAGGVQVDGEDVREMNIHHLRKHIALVSQEPILFDRSIKDNITYGMESVKDSEIVEAAQKANIHKFISELPDGYNTRVGDKGAQLSGGQKQRVAIARALIRNPKILLLDEATSALDTESEKLVQEALDKASEGRTCIVIAHRLSTVINATCILVCSGGKVVEQGTHDELMAMRGAYYQLSLKQQKKQNVGQDVETAAF
ncbi:unnamed protein product, partial [Mesorhabditis belari]|uniref:ABC-type xenobiotic transporter n=1 Tax=Mesorhabditis belari TaxID=2138241 RepID=A0AAF3EH90_9BILA